MDAVLGHRPTTRPSILLDTSEQPDDVEEEESLEEEAEEDEAAVDQSRLAHPLFTMTVRSSQYRCQSPLQQARRGRRDHTPKKTGLKL